MKHDSYRRDLFFSYWHRHNLPDNYYNFDVDVMHFDKDGNPLFMMETKHAGWNESKDHFRIKCFKNTATKLGIPFFVVQYFFEDNNNKIFEAEDFFDGVKIANATFKVIAKNSMAMQWVGETGETFLTEQQFIKFLGELRHE